MEKKTYVHYELEELGILDTQITIGDLLLKDLGNADLSNQIYLIFGRYNPERTGEKNVSNIF